MTQPLALGGFTAPVPPPVAIGATSSALSAAQNATSAARTAVRRGDSHSAEMAAAQAVEHAKRAYHAAVRAQTRLRQLGRMSAGQGYLPPAQRTYATSSPPQAPPSVTGGINDAVSTLSSASQAVIAGGGGGASGVLGAITGAIGDIGGVVGDVLSFL